MRVKNAVVMDFDGTIADAEAVLLKIYKPLAQQYGWPELTKKDYYRLKKGSPRDAMRWANIKLWQIPKLLRAGRLEYRKHAADIKLFGGMEAVLEELEKDYDLFILSSNNGETVRNILDKNNINTKISILRGSPLFGKDKALKRLIRTGGYDAGASWMIGDEIRDVEAGRKAGMRTIGVSWGLQSKEGIQKASPDHIAKKPDDILKFIYNKSRQTD